jgi:hypothetical protein
MRRKKRDISFLSGSPAGFSDELDDQDAYYKVQISRIFFEEGKPLPEGMPTMEDYVRHYRYMRDNGGQRTRVPKGMKLAGKLPNEPTPPEIQRFLRERKTK